MAELKAKDFEDLIKRLNPFGIRAENGEASTFDDYGKCYLFVLMFLRERFHKGFIDLPLALHLLTQIPLQDAKRIARKFPFVKLDNDIYLCEWEAKELNPKYKAELIMRALHTLSETKFSTDFYNWAWDEFCRQDKYNAVGRSFITP